MTFDIYSPVYGWVDITPYIKFQGVDGSRNDIDGSNAGRVIQNALLYRERLATKYKWNFTTKPITMETALMIEGLLMPEYFNIRTDYYSSSVTTYECYSNNVTKTYVINKGNGRELVKLSFPIVQR